MQVSKDSSYYDAFRDGIIARLMGHAREDCPFTTTYCIEPEDIHDAERLIAAWQAGWDHGKSQRWKQEGA
jgi:ribosome modulation factor